MERNNILATFILTTIICLFFLIAGFLQVISGAESFWSILSYAGSVLRFLYDALPLILLGVALTAALLWLVRKIRASRAPSQSDLKILEYAAKEENVAQRDGALWKGADAGTRRVLTIAGADFAFRYCPPGARASCGDFWIAETPATQAQWDAIGVKKAKSGLFKDPKAPVENVDGKERADYVEKLRTFGVSPEGWRFDLPTREQWEYARRADASRFSGVESVDGAADGEIVTYDGGLEKPNDWGVRDMLGVVEERADSDDGGAGVKPRVGFRLILVRDASV